jgi:hypothetical protein
MGHRWRRATFYMAGAGGRAARQGRAGGHGRARRAGQGAGQAGRADRPGAK